ncbi:tRNA lysidine(34) synthetase TilS [Candidatus Vidania fulgoroideorum]
MKKINNFIKENYKKKKKIAIAYSGGLDSNLLLYYYKKFLGNKIILINIIHNLNKNEKKNCKIISKINKLKFFSKRIIIKNYKLRKMGKEGAYRYYRYKKFLEVMKKKNIKILLLGHNNDDLVETFLINIFRGTGIHGLNSLKKIIKIKNFFFIRPFIKFDRKFLIEKIIKNKKIIIVYDRTNNDLSILRNFIRMIIKKYISKKIPFYKNSINNIISNSKEFLKILKIIAKKDLKKTMLKINKLNKLNKLRRKNLLIYYIRKKILIPSSKWLNEFDKQLKSKNFFFKKKNIFFFIKKKKIFCKKMKILVQKFGGTSLGNKKRIKKISKRICKFIEKGYKLIVVVSAKFGYTNKYEKYCKNKKFSDIVLFTGEYISLGILCDFLNDMGKKVNYLSSWQIPILTDSNFSFAKILKISSLKFYKYFLDYDVIVVPGFQGINKNGEITTIGRGGSDNTAIEIANCLNVECYIYTDVKGIYDKDPNLFKNCKIKKKILDIELIEISSLGAKVLQLDSVINCIKKRTKIKVLSSFSKFNSINNEKKKGTEIIFSKMINFSLVVTNVIMVTFITKKNKILKIINIFNKKNINIDNICFFKFIKKYIFSFSVDKKFKIKKKYKYLAKNMVKFSLVGLGIKNYCKNFFKIINLLKKNNINYYCFTTSEIKISFLIKKRYKKKIINIFNNIKL